MKQSKESTREGRGEKSARRIERRVEVCLCAENRVARLQQRHYQATVSKFLCTVSQLLRGYIGLDVSYLIHLGVRILLDELNERIKPNLFQATFSKITV